jgi:hypothetical protein
MSFTVRVKADTVDGTFSLAESIDFASKTTAWLREIFKDTWRASDPEANDCQQVRASIEGYRIPRC